MDFPGQNENMFELVFYRNKLFIGTRFHRALFSGQNYKF